VLEGEVNSKTWSPSVEPLYPPTASAFDVLPKLPPYENPAGKSLVSCQLTPFQSSVVAIFAGGEPPYLSPEELLTPADPPPPRISATKISYLCPASPIP